MLEQEGMSLKHTGLGQSIQYEAMSLTLPGAPALRRLGEVHLGENAISAYLCKCLIFPSPTKERLIICTIVLLISRAWENKSDV